MQNEIDAMSKLLALAKCLKDFSLIDLRDLLKVSSKEIWQAGEQIFNEGSYGRDMYIICSGKVNVWRSNSGKIISLSHLSDGDSFGEMGLVCNVGRSAGVSALEKTVALRIHYDKLSQAPSATTILYRNIAQSVSERLKVANDIIVFHSHLGE